MTYCQIVVLAVLLVLNIEYVEAYRDGAVFRRPDGVSTVKLIRVRFRIAR